MAQYQDKDDRYEGRKDEDRPDGCGLQPEPFKDDQLPLPPSPSVSSLVLRIWISGKPVIGKDRLSLFRGDEVHELLGVLHLFGEN